MKFEAFLKYLISSFPYIICDIRSEYRQYSHYVLSSGYKFNHCINYISSIQIHIYTIFYLRKIEILNIDLDKKNGFVKYILHSNI